MSPVAAFLRSLPRHQWGRSDCCLVLADWVMARRCIDPASELRGRYADRAAAEALWAGWGGLPRLVGRLARRAGCRLVPVAAEGDIAVVMVQGEVFGAIRSTSLWGAQLEGGLAMFDPSVVRVAAAWRV